MEDGGLICFDLESLEGEVYVTRNVLHWDGEVPAGWIILSCYPGIRMEIFGERLLVFSGEHSGRL